MTRLPVVSGRECVMALERVGFVVRRRRGAHIVLTREDPFAQVVVPDHRELKRGTLRGILRDAGLTVEEFIGLL